MNFDEYHNKSQKELNELKKKMNENDLLYYEKILNLLLEEKVIEEFREFQREDDIFKRVRKEDELFKISLNYYNDHPQKLSKFENYEFVLYSILKDKLIDEVFKELLNSENTKSSLWNKLFKVINKK